MQFKEMKVWWMETSATHATEMGAGKLIMISFKVNCDTLNDLLATY